MVKLAERENPLFGARIGDEPPIQAELKTILCSYNNDWLGLSYNANNKQGSVWDKFK